MSTLQSALLEILIAVITVVIPIVAKYLISFVSAKTTSAKKQATSEEETRLLDSINDTVADTVTYVNQTFVNTLKNKNEFTAENQKVAFKLALDNVESILSDEAKQFITNNYGDINTWLTTKIEAAVNTQKTE